MNGRNANPSIASADAPREQEMSFLQRALLVSVIFSSVAMLSAALVYAADVLLLTFLGIVLAVLLRSLTNALTKRTALEGHAAFSCVLGGIILILSAMFWLLGSGIVQQLDQLSQRIPAAIAEGREWLSRYQIGREILKQAPPAEQVVSTGSFVLNRATGIASGAVGMLANVVVVLFVGIFLAVEPRLYVQGFLGLLPARHRPAAEQILDESYEALQGWLEGTAVSMTVVGVLTWLGLKALGVPLALALGLISGLLSFIPNIGPVLSVVPAAMVAFPNGVAQVGYVMLLYLVVQGIETYGITPFVQRRLNSLPQALIIVAQLFLGVLFGGLGLIAATPLLAVAIVVISVLYLETPVSLLKRRPRPDRRARAGEQQSQS